MRHWQEIENILKNKQVSDVCIRAVRSFFLRLSFPERQRMFGIFFGWPEEAPFFAGLVRKKAQAAESKNEELLKEVFEEEKKYIDELTEQL